MRHIKALFTLSALWLASCSAAQNDTASNMGESDPAQNSSASIAAPDPAKISVPANEDGVIELIWDDLLPQGEEALLAEMYSEFFEQLESDMIQNAQTLMEAGQAQDAFDPDMIAEGSANDTMEQIGTFNVVEDLNNTKIRLPGYVVPLDFNAESQYSEFLLVPYFGACLHSPPPPPNQIILVKASPPASVDNIYDPVWLEGTLTTGKFNSELASAAYELQLSQIEPYEF